MRLIDADKLKMKLYGFERYTGIDEAPYEYAEAVLNKEPTVDAVPVIRCKDCKWYEMGEEETYCRELGIFNTDPTSYCSYARRKEE